MPTDKQQIVEEEKHKVYVRSRVAEDSSFDRPYVVMNILATVVASYGLLENSAAVVIGAMIIAMLLGPISGVGLALVDGNNRLLAKAGVTLIGGIALVLITAFFIGLLNREIPATNEMTSRTAPNIFDLMIALGGGAAGGYAVISKRLSVAFVGVAIATALVPPLTASGMFLARGQFDLAGGAFLLAFANIVGIQVACSVVFFLAGFRKIAKRESFGRAFLMQSGLSLIVLLILAALLTINLRSEVSMQLYEGKVRDTLKAEMLTYPGAYLDDVLFSLSTNGAIVRALVQGPHAFSAQQVAKMESGLPSPPGHARWTLRIRYVYTTVMSANGPLYSADETGADHKTP